MHQSWAMGSMQPLGIVAADFAADVGAQPATVAGQALHLSDSPGPCAGVVVPVGLPIDELDFDLSIANLIGLHTGIAAEISISAHRSPSTLIAIARIMGRAIASASLHAPRTLARVCLRMPARARSAECHCPR